MERSGMEWTKDGKTGNGVSGGWRARGWSSKNGEPRNEVHGGWRDWEWNALRWRVQGRMERWGMGHTMDGKTENVRPGGWRAQGWGRGNGEPRNEVLEVGQTRNGVKGMEMPGMGCREMETLGIGCMGAGEPRDGMHGVWRDWEWGCTRDGKTGNEIHGNGEPGDGLQGDRKTGHGVWGMQSLGMGCMG